MKNKLILAAVFLLGTAAGFSLDGINIFNEKRPPCFPLERLYKDGDHLVNPLMQVESPPGTDA